MWVNFLRGALRVGLVSRVFSLVDAALPWFANGKRRVGGGIAWLLGNLRNIRLDENVSLVRGGWLYLPLHNRESRIRIEAGTAIGNDFVITANDSIHIGRDCLISYRVTIMDHSHITGWNVNPVTSGLTLGQSVKIGARCFIGCNVVIMPGICLGSNCIVGANSVVTKSFEAGSVIAGAPARLLRVITPFNILQSPP